MTFDDQFEACGVKVIHHFGAREYAKETLIPAGITLTQHVHDYDHLSILASGSAIVTVDGQRQHYNGPKCLLIAAGKSHGVEALTDVVWYCCHGTDEKDPARIDATLIHKGD